MSLRHLSNPHPANAIQESVQLSRQLQFCFIEALGPMDWRNSINPELMHYLRSKRAFATDSWQDLLRAVRNIDKHIEYVKAGVPAMREQLNQGAFRCSALP